MRKPFNKVKFSQLHTLYNIVASSSVRDETYIKRIYLDTEMSFKETLAFLIDLKILRKNLHQLSLSENLSVSVNDRETFSLSLLQVLFSQKAGTIWNHLREFLLQFQLVGGDIRFKANEQQKITFSALRNLLLELKFIGVNKTTDVYFVYPQYQEIFFEHFQTIKKSPESLKRDLAEKSIVGLNAEKAVIEFETRRLTEIIFVFKEIEHISQVNVMAGYDIKSFENYLDNNSKRINRYIEVKAVSGSNYSFFWSRNEMEIAKVFGESYYLYLLPMTSINTFDFEKLIIVNNPFQNIALTGREWEKVEETVSFSKASGPEL